MTKKSIAICPLSDDPARSQEQKQSLLALEQSFNIEWCLRSEVSPYTPYTTYSQAVNEGILSSTAEYIVFFNPRFPPYPEDVIGLYNDLNNGFCLSSLAGMGGWGVSRELFRVIGLFDERFLGGEYEDNDFLVRIKQAGYAIKWRGHKDRYTVILRSADNPLFGLTRSLINTKWYEEDEVYYRTDLFKHEKLLPIWQLSNSNEKIRRSWKKWEDSDLQPDKDGLYWRLFEECDRIQVSDKVASSSIQKVDIQVEFTRTLSNSNSEENHLLIHSDASKPTNIDIGLCRSTPTRPRGFWGDEGIFRLEISDEYTRWWRSNYIISDNTVDVRIFHQGTLILYNTSVDLNDPVKYNITVNQFNFHVS